VTYTTNENPPKTYTVKLANPLKRGNVLVECGALSTLPLSMSSLSIRVVDHRGLLNQSYNGTVYVNAFSIGGSVVKIDGKFGNGVVSIFEGLGTFAVDATHAIPGDTVYFETISDRLDTVRSAIVVAP
jgi:hypothetical protein